MAPHALIEARRLDDAQTLLDAVPMVDQDPLYDQMLAQLNLAREAARSPELLALEEKLAADPGNLDLLEQIAVHYSAAGQYREALESLLFILRADINHNDGATKKALLDTIASLGKGDPLAHPRMTLQVHAVFREKTETAAKTYLEAQPKAQLYIGFGDFHLVDLQIREAWLNGGFGKAYRMAPSDLA